MMTIVVIAPTIPNHHRAHPLPHSTHHHSAFTISPLYGTSNSQFLIIESCTERSRARDLRKLGVVEEHVPRTRARPDAQQRRTATGSNGVLHTDGRGVGEAAVMRQRYERANGHVGGCPSLAL